MIKLNTEVLVSQYAAWKANRRFLVGDVRPSTPWAKRREAAARKKQWDWARANRRFVIKA